ncbi:hypothetical protein F5Y16DRAFT_363348 [Xylariaceae sp. FL0255]|nr:hypothetical protein F5Y16DRAFT_363348 [Xylariaceae sp. FL0255]
MSEPETRRCIICNGPDAKLCGRCKNTAYCGKDCQKADYHTHKHLCAQFAAFDVTARPTQNHVRVLFFPVDEDRPKFIWVAFKQKASGEQLDFDNILRDCNQQFPCEYDETLSRRPANDVYLCMRNKALNAFYPTPPNKSIETITSHMWHGPVAAYGKLGTGDDAKKLRDFDLNDFLHIVHAVTAHDHVTLRPAVPFIPLGITTTVIGVRVNSIGDQVALGRPPMEKINFCPWDNVFDLAETSSVAARVGLSIVTRHCFPHPKWFWGANPGNTYGTHPDGPYHNPHAFDLHVSWELVEDPKRTHVDDFEQWGALMADREYKGWGVIYHSWQERAATFTACRKDKRTLSVEHMKALHEYCKKICIKGFFLTDESKKKELFSSISKDSFSTFWSKWCAEKYKRGEVFDDISPYAV